MSLDLSHMRGQAEAREKWTSEMVIAYDTPFISIHSSVDRINILSVEL